MKQKIILTVIAATIASGVSYLFYKKKKRLPKEVLSIMKYDDNDYVIYFDDQLMTVEENI